MKKLTAITGRCILILALSTSQALFAGPGSSRPWAPIEAWRPPALPVLGLSYVISTLLRPLLLTYLIAPLSHIVEAYASTPGSLSVAAQFPGLSVVDAYLDNQRTNEILVLLRRPDHSFLVRRINILTGQQQGIEFVVFAPDRVHLQGLNVLRITSNRPGLLATQGTDAIVINGEGVAHTLHDIRAATAPVLRSFFRGDLVDWDAQFDLPGGYHFMLAGRSDRSFTNTGFEAGVHEIFPIGRNHYAAFGRSLFHIFTFRGFEIHTSTTVAYPAHLEPPVSARFVESTLLATETIGYLRTASRGIFFRLHFGSPRLGGQLPFEMLAEIPPNQDGSLHYFSGHVFLVNGLGFWTYRIPQRGDVAASAPFFYEAASASEGMTFLKAELVGNLLAIYWTNASGNLTCVRIQLDEFLASLRPVEADFSLKHSDKKS